jgi:hypothetical protein
MVAAFWRLSACLSGKPEQLMDDNRTLTEADVRAIAAQIEIGITQRFQLNVGKGVIAMAWKVILYALVALAGYGAAGGFRKFF